MKETPEMIRRQMDQTKSQLADKLQSLENQVAETVQSTGSAVNSTAEAVQQTFETVTDAVHDVVHSVTNALDVRRQIERHPWLVLGGAAVLGFLAVELLTTTKKRAGQRTPLPSSPPADNASEDSGRPADESRATAKTVAAARESGAEKSSWNQLKEATLGALIGVLPGIASRIVPRMVDQLLGNWVGASTDRSESHEEGPQGSTQRKESSEAATRLRIASSENVCSRKSF